MSEEKDNSLIWNLAWLGLFLASLWFLVKYSWQLIQLLCGYDAKKGAFSIWTAVGAWIGVGLLVWLISAAV